MDIVLPYQIASKEEARQGEVPIWTKRPNLPEVTKSWQNYMTKQVIQDFQTSVLQVSDVAYDEESIAIIPHLGYEFPNGYNNEYGVERFKIPEALFDTSFVKGPSANTTMSVAQVVTTSVGKSRNERFYKQISNF